MPAEPTEANPHQVADNESAEPAEQRTHLRPVPDTEQPDDTAAHPTDSEPGSSAADHNTETSTVPEPLISAWDWTRETFTPDSGLWTTRPLAPDEVVERAKTGSQLPAMGPLRVLSIGHGWCGAAATCALRGIEWAFCQHLARASVFSLLLAGLLLYPPTRAVIGYTLAPFAWGHDLLTP